MGTFLPQIPKLAKLSKENCIKLVKGMPLDATINLKSPSPLHSDFSVLVLPLIDWFPAPNF